MLSADETFEALKRTVKWFVFGVVLAASLVTTCVIDPPWKQKKKSQYPLKCLGCGSEFVSDNPKAKDVESCPNCPLSWEEFEKLIEDSKK